MMSVLVMPRIASIASVRIIVINLEEQASLSFFLKMGVKLSKKYQSNTYPSEQRVDFFRSINIQFLIHELKGPLDVLDTNLRMLDQIRVKGNAEATIQEKTLERSMRNVTKLREVIYSLLEVGASQSGQVRLQKFKISDTVYEILFKALDTSIYGKLETSQNEDPDEILQQSGIELNIQKSLNGIYSCQDKTKFTYILGNLVRNALHHRISSVRIAMSIDRENLVLDIVDDGPGVKAEEYKHMFQLYAEQNMKKMTKMKGHGLGLACSRIMARHLGGDVTLVSKNTPGAHFSLRLPLKYEYQRS